MPWHPQRPYNTLPDLARLSDLDLDALYPKVIEAHVVLARLTQTVSMLPDPEVALSVCATLEAQASSAIEGLWVEKRQLLSPPTTPMDDILQRVFANRAALSLKPPQSGLDLDTIKACGRRLMGEELDVREKPGTYVGNSVTGEVIYTPPEGKALIEAKLTALCDDLNRPLHRDPLIAMAMGHYQFEAIHPFPDGNGRTGRALNGLYLTSRGVISDPRFLVMSPAIWLKRPQYYQRLLAVTREADWQGWVGYLLDAVIVGSCQAMHRLLILNRAQLGLTRYFETQGYRPTEAERLSTILFRSPQFRLQDWVSEGFGHRHTVSKRLSALTDAGILTRTRDKAGFLFENVRFVEILSDRQARFTPYPL